MITKCNTRFSFISCLNYWQQRKCSLLQICILTTFFVLNFKNGKNSPTFFNEKLYTVNWKLFVQISFGPAALTGYRISEDEKYLFHFFSLLEEAEIKAFVFSQYFKGLSKQKQIKMFNFIKLSKKVIGLIFKRLLCGLALENMTYVKLYRSYGIPCPQEFWDYLCFKYFLKQISLKGDVNFCKNHKVPIFYE